MSKQPEREYAPWMDFKKLEELSNKAAADAKRRGPVTAIEGRDADPPPGYDPDAHAGVLSDEQIEILTKARREYGLK